MMLRVFIRSSLRKVLLTPPDLFQIRIFYKWRGVSVAQPTPSVSSVAHN